MLIRGLLYGLLAALSAVVFSPVVQSGNEIHVLFEFDLAMLLFTGASDPYASIERYLDWYPNIGVVRIIVSVVLACLAVYKFWKVDDPDPVFGTTEAARRSKRFVEKDSLDQEPQAVFATGAGRPAKRFVDKDPPDEESEAAFATGARPAEGPDSRGTAAARKHRE